MPSSTLGSLKVSRAESLFIIKECSALTYLQSHRKRHSRLIPQSNRDLISIQSKATTHPMAMMESIWCSQERSRKWGGKAGCSSSLTHLRWVRTTILQMTSTKRCLSCTIDQLIRTLKVCNYQREWSTTEWQTNLRRWKVSTKSLKSRRWVGRSQCPHTFFKATDRVRSQDSSRRVNKPSIISTTSRLKTARICCSLVPILKSTSTTDTGTNKKTSIFKYKT